MIDSKPLIPPIPAEHPSSLISMQLNVKNINSVESNMLVINHQSPSSELV